MKVKLLTFANAICGAILLFGFLYYCLLTWFYFMHPASPISAQLNSMREDVKVWMERALAFTLGSSMGSKSKDDLQKETTADLVTKLAASSPAPALIKQAEKVAEEVIAPAPQQPAQSNA